MPGLLKSSQHEQRQQAAHMQAVGSGIESGVECAALCPQPARQMVRVGDLMEQAAPREFGINVLHDRSCRRRGQWQHWSNLWS